MEATVERKSPHTLGTERLTKLLMQYATPAIIAMTATSLYNMVDSIFIGQGCGKEAIAGLAVTFPFANLSAAFGAMVGIGASIMIAMKLGQKDRKSAELLLGNVVMLNTWIGGLFSIICLLFLEPILRLFGASDATLPYAKEYMQVLLYGNIITHIYFGLNDVVRSSGYPRKAMLFTITAVCINALFNYIFIFILDMGIAGAAWGTLCAQLTALMLLIRHYTDPKTYLRFQRGIMKVRWDFIKSILGIGMSPFLINVCACLVVSVINNSLLKYGDDIAVGAYGIVNRIVFMFVMIVMGLNQGMQPIVAYNYGASQFNRVRKVLMLTIACAVTVTTIGFLLCEFASLPLVSMFTTDEGLKQAAIDGMHLLVIAFPVVGAQIVSVGFFQSIGVVKKSIFLSLSRQLIFLIPSLLILPEFWGLNGVWLSLPFADVLATIVTTILLVYQLKKFKRVGNIV